MDFSPREIVSELDRHIVGQFDAKRAIAIALRNRWRRRQLDEPLRSEIQPKNILMIGPTGVGKTEIARRSSKLEAMPFIKVEATKFTEVGYMGRDVDQIVRDLLDVAMAILREKNRKSVRTQAEEKAADSVIMALKEENAIYGDYDQLKRDLDKGKYDDLEVQINVKEQPKMPSFDIPGIPAGAQIGMLDMGDIFGKIVGSKTQKKHLRVKEAYQRLISEESDKMFHQDSMVEEAIALVEQEGIVFIDEIDKICSKNSKSASGGDVSREGVQRDLLPFIEGTTVSTKHGPVRTNHILFIASGAFHVSKPSDLLPELQGRLPIRVELHPLTKENFEQILTEPEVSLIKQYKALLLTENVDLQFTNDGIDVIAQIATDVNESVEDIGARRLHTILEKTLENISFSASDMKEATIIVDREYVETNIKNFFKKSDLSKFIL